MENGYDMCVDFDALSRTEEKLEKLEYDLVHSTDRMVKSIRKAQEYLAGNQFEKAKTTTIKCLETTEKAERNIKYAREYVTKLKDVLAKYGECGYDGVDL